MGRTRSFLIRFTDEEYALLEEMAEEDKDAKTKKKKQKNISAYIRKCIFESKGHPFDLKKELKNTNYQIRKIGVNINQVAAKVNSGYYGPADIHNLEIYLQLVEKQLSLLMDKIGETYGSDKTDAYRECQRKRDGPSEEQQPVYHESG